MTNGPEQQGYPSAPNSWGYPPPAPAADRPALAARSPKRRRIRWVVTAGVVAVLATVAVVLVWINPFAGGSEPNEDAAYHIQPQTMLLSLDQIRRTTTIDFRGDAVLDYAATSRETGVTPESCALMASPANSETWGSAPEVASEFYRDDPKDFSANVWLGVAQFKSNADAAASLKAVNDATQACGGFIWKVGDKVPGPWKARDVQTGDGSVGYVITESMALAPWGCGQDYRVIGNISVSVTLCSQNPADLATALGDLLIEKVRAKG